MRPPVIRIAHDELIVDNFAGGGGASLGIEMALGRSPDIAINHDPEAIAMHKRNHPTTKHYCEDVWKVDPNEACRGRQVGLAWFSPDCAHFSKAKGGKPVEKKIRGLAWVVVRWAKAVRPRVICLENVQEFADWGPLLQDGMPCPLRKGFTYRRWRRQLEKCGYKLDERELKACDYGAPTIRTRLFIVARRDGERIQWPEPTHGPGLEPYHTAAECIDWSIACPSIFTRQRPLAENTLRRIAKGIQRYVIDAAEPFIVPVAHAGDSRTQPIDEPLRTVTGGRRGEHALVTPFIAGLAHGEHAVRPGSRVRGLDVPVGTIHASGGNHALVAPFLKPRYGERQGQEPRTRAIDTPAPTIVPTGNGGDLVTAFLAQHNTQREGFNPGRSAERPMSTITGRGTQQQLALAHIISLKGSDRRSASASAPMLTICAGGWHLGEVRAFLLKYYGTDQRPDMRTPMHTLTAKDRIGLVTVRGQDYVIADIGMRMLAPRELYRAQGFGDAYQIERDVDGQPFTKTAQVRMCGNSVCPPVAAAVALAQFSEPEALTLGALLL